MGGCLGLIFRLAGVVMSMIGGEDGAVEGAVDDSDEDEDEESEEE